MRRAHLRLPGFGPLNGRGELEFRSNLRLQTFLSGVKGHQTRSRRMILNAGKAASAIHAAREQHDLLHRVSCRRLVSRNRSAEISLEVNSPLCVAEKEKHLLNDTDGFVGPGLWLSQAHGEFKKFGRIGSLEYAQL